MRWVIYLSALLIGTALIAQDDLSIAKSLSVSGAEQLIIEVERGTVKLVGSDNSVIKVEGKLDEATEQLVFEQRGSSIVFQLKIESDNWGTRDGASLEFSVPRNLSTKVSTVSADIGAQGLLSNIDLKSVSGDIEVSDVGQAPTSEHSLISVSGDIEFKNLHGKLNLNVVSGDIEGKGDSAHLTAKSVSGEIKLMLARIEHASVSSVSGDVELSGSCKDSVDIKMSTVNGEAKLLTDQSYQGKLKMQTGPGGDIKNRLSDHRPESSFIGDAFLQITLGGKSNAKNRVGMTTVSGTLIID